MNAKEPSSCAFEDKISAVVAMRAGTRLINTMLRHTVLASILRPTNDSSPLTLKALPNFPAACSRPRKWRRGWDCQAGTTPRQGRSRRNPTRDLQPRQFRIRRIAVRPTPMVNFPAPKEDRCCYRESDSGRTSRDISHSDRQDVRDVVREFRPAEKRYRTTRTPNPIALPRLYSPPGPLSRLSIAARHRKGGHIVDSRKLFACFIGLPPPDVRLSTA